MVLSVSSSSLCLEGLRFVIVALPGLFSYLFLLPGCLHIYLSAFSSLLERFIDPYFCRLYVFFFTVPVSLYVSFDMPLSFTGV